MTSLNTAAPPAMTPADDAVCIEATRRWLEQVVIGLNLCPFAKAPYRLGRVRLAVSHARHTDDFLQQLDEELQRLAATPISEIETTLFIEPRLFADFAVFNAMLDWADQAIIDNHVVGVIQIAPFHPQFQFADTAADDMGNYTNRSPYPTLHLIRESSIDKAVASIPDPAVIYERNIAVLRRMGAAGWAQLTCPHAPASGEPS